MMGSLAMILLGNGFDIALGAKTKYSDFAQSEEFQVLLPDNELAQYIWKKFEMQDKKWVDVELELANYSLHLSDKYCDTIPEEVTLRFKREYEELNNSLAAYLSGCNSYTSIDAMNDLVAEWDCLLKTKDLEPRVFTLNYLRGEYRFFDLFNDLIDKSRIPRHIHGKVAFYPEKNPEIVFGIDKACGIECKEHGFLFKCDNQFRRLEGFEDYVNDAQLFIVFGSSLGITDRWYFERIFKGKENCTFMVYYHDDTELSSMKETIGEIVGGNYTLFTEQNTVVFIQS